MVSEKIVKIGLQRLKGFLYYVNKQGNIAKTPSARGRKGNQGEEIVFKTGVTKQPGFLYFLDKDGDLSRAKMERKVKKA